MTRKIVPKTVGVRKVRTPALQWLMVSLLLRAAEIQVKSGRKKRSELGTVWLGKRLKELYEELNESKKKEENEREREAVETAVVDHYIWEWYWGVLFIVQLLTGLLCCGIIWFTVSNPSLTGDGFMAVILTVLMIATLSFVITVLTLKYQVIKRIKKGER